MDNVATSKGGVDRSTDHGENQDDLEVENAIADDFGSYDCFMQPFYSAEMGDEQTKVMEVECFDQIDNTRPKVIFICSCLGEQLAFHRLKLFYYYY